MKQSVHHISHLDTWLALRQRARTDLLWLANDVLGYPDVCREVHGEILDALHKFKGGEDDCTGVRKCQQGVSLENVKYIPYEELSQIASDVQVLILYPRDHLKSTIATMVHCVVLIINFPNIRILVSSGTGDQVHGFVRGIKNHFERNEKFRFLFPELCPKPNKAGKIEDFGNQDGFSVANRSGLEKERTLSTTTVGSTVASGHYDVLIDDDIVDKENVRTQTEIQRVNEHFGMLWPLLQRYEGQKKGPRYVIGTRYDFSDLYGKILDGEAKLPEAEQQWKKVIRSAAPNWPQGPFLWPERYGYEALRKIENDPTQGPPILASQYLMNPIPSTAGLVKSEDQIVFLSRKQINELYAFCTLHCTVDLAGMEPSTNKAGDNDYTSINVHGFGHDGTLYFIDIRHGRFTPFEVIDQLFDVHRKHPRLIDIKIETEAHSRVLGPFLLRQMAKRNHWLPIVPIKRDNRTSKQHRINGLQPMFLTNRLKFADDLPCKTHLILEIMRFPKYAHDDILDTCADAMQNADGSPVSDLMPNEKTLPNRKPYVESEDGTRVWASAPTEGIDRILYLHDQQYNANTVDDWTGL
jgi:predicted phage terminase large subunit-like protein